jgi:pimeloyl-ACP methyl ester carboxylesterase
MNQANQTTVSSPSTSPTLHHVRCPGASKTDPAGHQMAYWSWGDPANPRTVVCVHGLSRQGRDFDVLAQRLSAHCHVVCPDVAGRGHSDWLAEPQQYQILTYAGDMVQLVQHLKASKGITAADWSIDWVGTSMGGLIGLALSTVPPQATGAQLRRMVLNDVGPRLRYEAIVRIGDYLGVPRQFATEQEAADYIWSISTSFGPHTPAQWLALSRPMLRQAPGGVGFVLHYDPSIAIPFKAIDAEGAAAGQAAVWQMYDGLKADTLLLRGAESDLLDADTAQEMTQRGAKARLVEFAGVGHAPTLVADDQVAVVEGFLLA